ncbi:MAG: hypothetical protein M1817_006204 [Caeruleum heppii]|nr:MAG: hypothetical protein M1817_006204 [Caeruleum heppii]
MPPAHTSPTRWCYAALVFWTALAAAVSSEQPLQPVKKASYSPGQAIPVSCLNRTIDTGEHIQDEKGQLQYIPFPTCNETNRPLELYFGVEKGKTSNLFNTNCTIPFITDEFFHLLEFYIHNDAPLTCRIPARPLSGGETEVTSSPSSTSDDYIPIIFALAGNLQKSHVHIANNLNILLHAAPRATHPGVIDSATAYSISPLNRNTRIVIGDALPLRLSIRWYPTTNLPSGWTGVGGHLFVSTFVYCALCVGATAACCLVYFRAVEFPQKLRRYGADRMGGDGGAGGPRGGLGGYGYGVGNGYGFAGGNRGAGKFD